MKKLSFFLAFLFLATLGVAQGYFTAGGVRVGDGYGLTLQQRVAKKVTIEGIVKNTPDRNEFSVTLLAERHVALVTRRLNFYTGLGVHKGFINNQNELEEEEKFDSPFGLTAITGLELTLGKFNLSYDFKPALNLTGGTQTFYPETALSLRYVIVGNKVFKDMAKKKKKRKKAKERAKKKKNGEGIYGIFKKKD